MMKWLKSRFKSNSKMGGCMGHTFDDKSFTDALVDITDLLENKYGIKEPVPNKFFKNKLTKEHNEARFRLKTALYDLFDIDAMDKF